MKPLNTNNTIRQLYGKVIVLVCLSHVIFTIIFASLKVVPLVIYSLLSCFYYLGLYRLVRQKHYRVIIILIHFEICLFTTICCCFLGWGLGFPIYLIALSSLVYFCPFKRKYIPYLFSFVEIILFYTLKIYTSVHPPIVTIMDSGMSALYYFNSMCCFAIILYAAFTFKVSATTTEEALSQDNDRLQNMVDHDALTYLWSRPYFVENFNRISASGNNIILAMLDIDDFKKINDTYGHECGDYVLSELSKIVRAMCPINSGICRWGGEEFIIIFYGYGPDYIFSLIEDIRCKIAAFPFSYQGNRLHITMTFGVSSTMESRDMQELIRLADNRMYYGKRNGKNILITTDSTD